MTVAFQCMFRILERWNNNQVTPSLSKPHELIYRSNRIVPECKDYLGGLSSSDLTSHKIRVREMEKVKSKVMQLSFDISFVPCKKNCFLS